MSDGISAQDVLVSLKSTSSQERGWAARIIWSKKNQIDDYSLLQNSGNLLLDALDKETDERNIWHFLMALGELNYTPSITTIASYLDDQHPENIRGFAADALSRFAGEPFSQKLIDQLWELSRNDGSLVVRVNAIRALSNRYQGTKNIEISNQLFNLLESQNNTAIRTTIFDQIGKIASLEIVPKLVHIMITRRTEVEKKSAAMTLDKIARVNGYENRETLIKMVGSDINPE